MNGRVILSVLINGDGMQLIGCRTGVSRDPPRGQVVYEKNRLRCYGEKLDGAGPEGQYLIVQPPGYHLARENWLGSLDHDLARGSLYPPPCMGSGGT